MEIRDRERKEALRIITGILLFRWHTITLIVFTMETQDII